MGKNDFQLFFLFIYCLMLCLVQTSNAQWASRAGQQCHQSTFKGLCVSFSSVMHLPVLILIFIFQVSIFAIDRFAFVSFSQHTEDAFHHLFVKGWNDDYTYSYYSRQQVINAIQFANRRVIIIFLSAVYTFQTEGLDLKKTENYITQTFQLQI